VQLIQRPIECANIGSVLAAEPEPAFPVKAEHHAFPAEKRCINERLIAHGGVQK
jgi:hypothetical protein